MVNFENGTLVKGAYVVIDGVEYEVHMPQYSGNTPLSSEILNKMQADLQQADVDLKNLVNGTVLYKDTTGATEDITLSDEIENYDEYEIKYLGEFGEPYTTGRLSTAYIDRIHLNGVFLGVKSYTANGALKVSNARVSISGKALTFISNRWYEKPYNSGASDGTYQDTTNIKIVEVIGYKEA